MAGSCIAVAAVRIGRLKPVVRYSVPMKYASGTDECRSASQDIALVQSSRGCRRPWGSVSDFLGFFHADAVVSDSATVAPSAKTPSNPYPTATGPTTGTAHALRAFRCLSMPDGLAA